MGFDITKEAVQDIVAGNTTEKHLGENAGASPLMDLVARLSGQLNQQTAESNLYKGGAGYGGSFMNKDQLAARARGETLGAKPYGGWGGYGSGNPTMTNPTNGGSGGDTYVQPDIPLGGGDATPPIPGGGGGWGDTPVGNPIDPRGSGGGNVIPIPPRTPPGGAPPAGGANPPIRAGSGDYLPGGTGSDTAPPRSGSTNGTAPPRGGAPPRGAAAPETDPYAAFAQGGVPTWGGNLNPGDPGWNPAWAGGGPSGGGAGEAGGGYTAPPAAGGKANPNGGANATATAPARPRVPGLQEYSDPNVQQIYEALVAKGMRVDAAIDADSIRAMIAQGASPGLILKNYSAVMDRLGPNAFSMMHGQLGAMNGSVEDLTNGKWLQGTFANAGVEPGPLTPMGGLDTPMPQGSNGGSAEAPGSEGSVATVPTGGGGTGTQAPTDQPVSQQDGGNNDDDFDPPVNTGQPGQMLPVLMAKGKDWGPQTNPPKGMKPGDVYTDPKKGLTILGKDGRFAKATIDSETGKYRYNYETYGVTGPSIHQPKESIRPTVGGTQVIGYDEYGNPVFNDNGMFEQGDNASGVGDITPDAWNNSPDWRPEEPTGGLYGAFTELASGKMTDYENSIGENWRNMAANPATADDEDYKKLIAEYNKTPGKGIDEAYGAYNEMINSKGYSDVERGAIEGSAVRGASQGFQRGADDMRRQAARTGNANSAYAAMASMGSKYGQDLGEMNRQNQIKFADETQRRKETGASGMTNVAGLANTKAQFGLGASGDYAKEMARRREAATKGMGDYATFGRGLQSQGLSGLQGLSKDTEAAKQNTYAQIAQILGTSMGNTTDTASNTTKSGGQYGGKIW
ncbi:MAG: hypothetical protein IPP07_28720 [Holophagales bacterium]|nr:hypothetical protein [Holophagales bacterium]